MVSIGKIPLLSTHPVYIFNASVQSFCDRNSFSLFTIISFERHFISIEEFFIFKRQGISTQNFRNLFEQMFIMAHFITCCGIHDIEIAVKQFVQSFIKRVVYNPEISGCNIILSYYFVLKQFFISLMLLGNRIRFKNILFIDTYRNK